MSMRTEISIIKGDLCKSRHYPTGLFGTSGSLEKDDMARSLVLELASVISV